MNNYIPFPAYPDAAPVDLRFVFADEAPAGKRGFLKAVGDHFEFADGTTARFWGTNFNSGLCFPSHEYADQLAERLAMYGCNMVRFHQMDSEWATPNIFQFTKGPRQANSSAPDPISLDRLDYLIAALKRNGVYIYLDILTYRKFKSGDGLENVHLLGDCARPYCYTFPRLIELQKSFMEQLWNHVNPYTGLAYKDEPAIALSEAINEDDLFTRKVIRVEPYYSHYCELYRQWAAANDVDWDPENFDPDVNDPDQCRFKIHIMEQYYREMLAFQRNLGVKIPLTGTNWAINGGITKAQHVTDFNDGHAYFSWGRFNATERSYINESLSQSPGPFWRLPFHRLPDKPYFVSEWDMVWPCDFRAESPILMAALGCLQNWGGFTIHTYAYSNRHTTYQPLGQEVSSRSIGNGYHREGQFATWNDPAKFGLFYHAALLLRRGDVAPAHGSVAIKVDDPLLLPVNAVYPALPEYTRVGTTFDEVPATSAQAVIAPLEPHTLDPDKQEVTSDTGEMYRNWARKYGWIDTPRSQVLYGFLGHNHPLATSDVSVEVDSDFAVIAFSSLTAAPLQESDNILLTTIGRARNSGERREGGRVVDVGTTPIMAQVIKATLSLRTSQRNLQIWAINAEGFYVGKLLTTYEEGRLTFTIGAEYPALYYLLRTE